MSNISYKSFCWVIGTTSFRTAKLNLKIEEQLLLLEKFYNSIVKEDKWDWNKDIQERYYDYLKKFNFLSGNAKYKAKDAREKTSGLYDIGLVTDDRIITSVGEDLLELTKDSDFGKNNIFNIDKDAYIYLKQLLKTSIKVGDKVIRPLIVTIKSLMDLSSLSYDEFKYFIPLIKDYKSYELMIKNIVLYRENSIRVEDVIFNQLILMDNYKKAYKIFLENTITEDLFCLIGMNRKSKQYDKSYYRLYKNIKSIYLGKGQNYIELLESARNINQSPGKLWSNLIFKKSDKRFVKKQGRNSLNEGCPFCKCSNENELKKVFFKYLHVYKAMSTLSDYFDLNRRYFNLAEILIIEDNRIVLDIIPRHYFKLTINDLFIDAFKVNKDLSNSIKFSNISEAFNFDQSILYKSLSNELNIKINNAKQVKNFISNERLYRFNKLIDSKFTDSKLIELLKAFKKRDDKKIEDLVTDEATIPTIFEYVVGIIWYKISNRQGDILNYMKLSLEANLLPKTHAGGGSADIVYEYESCEFYPKHSLLIEVTLSDGSTQRRMEMEPVSRHLGDHRIKYSNNFDYSLFISTYLDKNVVSDFRYRKIMPYTKDEETIIGMKIISLDTDSLKKIIHNNYKYEDLYVMFDKYHNLPIETKNWHDKLIEEIIDKYNVE